MSKEANLGGIVLFVLGMLLVGAFVMETSSPPKPTGQDNGNTINAQSQSSAFAQPDQMKADVRGLTRLEQIRIRKTYAKTIEDKMLDAGMNADVYTRGRDATILVVKYVLIDKVLIHNFDKQNGEVLSQAKAVGFRKVTLTDGYEDSWSYDLQ